MKYERLILWSIILILIYKNFFVTEKLTNDDITAKISELYKADVGAIRNLSKLANHLTIDGKLVLPGGLDIEGPLRVKDNVTFEKDLEVKKQTTLHELYGGKKGPKGFKTIQVNGDHIMFKVGDHGYGFHKNGKNYHTLKDKNSYHTFDNKFYIEDSLNVRKDIGWNSGNTWNSKGKLTSDNNGTNIELHNNNNKPGLMLYANSENKGSKLIMNNKDGQKVREIGKHMPNTQKVRFIQISNVGKTNAHEKMAIMEIQALTLDGINKAIGKVPKFIGINKKSLKNNMEDFNIKDFLRSGKISLKESQLQNLTNNLYLNNDNNEQYWIGSDGFYSIEIDLDEEYDIAQITIFNRYNDEKDHTLDHAELTLLDENKNVVKRYQTGKWHRQYSKEFML